jgi:hypothetical protein
MTHATTDLAIRAANDAQDYLPVLSIEQAVQRYNSVIEFTRKVMKEGRDYGTIPGTGKKNEDGTPNNSSHTLLKPGAEKLCTIFALTPRFEDYRIVEDWDKGLFYYAYRCIVSRNGRDMGESIGSANSFEKKYRSTSRKCPACESDAIRRSKPDRNTRGEPGWYCWKKIGGCGQQFDAKDPAIIDQKETVDAMAAADKINTLQKMAQKRAFVGAALIATNASEFFTQDMEDADVPTGKPDFVDGELTGDDAAQAKDDAEFLAAWDRESAKHKIDPGVGRAVMRELFKKQKLDGPIGASFEIKTTVIEQFKALSSDQLQKFAEALAKAKAKGSSAANAITADQVATWDDVQAIAWDIAAANGETDPEKVVAAVQKYGSKLKTKDGTVQERIALITAIQTKAFDYEIGEIRTAGKAAA